MKLHLTAKNLRPVIEDETNNLVSEAEKATAMIFIRRHIHDTLQTKYLAKEDPRVQWVVLAAIARSNYRALDDSKICRTRMRGRTHLFVIGMQGTGKSSIRILVCLQFLTYLSL